MTSEVEICHSKRREMDQMKDSVQWLRKKDATSHIDFSKSFRLF